MAKKRPTLDAFLNSQAIDTNKKGSFKVSSAQKTPPSAKLPKKIPEQPLIGKTAPSVSNASGKPEIIRHMLYLPLPVYDQLQGLIFEEQRGQTKRRKTHDYLLDSIDLLFKEKGLKSISELLEKN